MSGTGTGNSTLEDDICLKFGAHTAAGAKWNTHFFLFQSSEGTASCVFARYDNQLLSATPFDLAPSAASSLGRAHSRICPVNATG